MKITLAIILSIITVNSFAQFQKVVLIEEGTGTWCHWCPRGDIYAQELQTNYLGQFVFIAVHHNDPMENAEYVNSLDLNGLPTGRIDRSFVSSLDPFNDLPQDMAQQLALIPPAGISVSTTWDVVTRDLTMTVSAEFTEDLEGDYRLVAIVVEDGVTGPAPAYNQSNAYSGGGNGLMGGYEDLPNPVSASIMVYNHIGRNLPGGFMGDPTSLPNSISNGETHSFTYSYTLPNEYNEEYVHVVGILVDASTGNVLNAGKSTYLPGYVNAKPFFHSIPQEHGFMGLNYQYDIVTHDPEHDELEITALTTLPPGLTLNDMGDGFAALTGVPTQLGTFDVTLNVNDGTWNVQQSFQIIIGEPQEDWIQVGAEGFTNFEASSIDLEISTEGIPFVLGINSNNNQVFVYEFTNDAWSQLGSSLPNNSFEASMTIGADGMPVVFTEGVISKWDGSQWIQLGNNLSGSDFIYPDIIKSGDGSLFTIHFAPPSSTDAYQFDGTNWQALGDVSDAFTIWHSFHLDENGQPILIYGADASNIAYSEVTRWDGSQWNQLGSYIEPASQTYYDHDVAVTPNGDVFAALTIGSGVQALNIYQFINEQWELIIENLANGGTSSCNLETNADGHLIVAFRDEGEGGKTSVMKFNGVTWNYMGLPGFTNIASKQSLALDPDGIPYVAYADANHDGSINVKKYEHFTTNILSPKLTKSHIKIYPNPNSGQFTLEYEKGNQYQIIDATGQVLKIGKLNSVLSTNSLNYQNITCTELEKGIYFIKVIGDNGFLTLKFLKH